MLNYETVKARIGALLHGASHSAGPALVPLPATLDRPEGRRRYLVAAPPGKTKCARALVIVLHGAGASAEQVLGLAFPPSPLSVWLEIAAREQCVVIAPDAGKGGWSDCFARPARVARKDDVGYIDALIEQAIAEHDVDPARVYLIGVSRGGWMAYRVATAIPHRLAAFSVVLAGMPPPGRASMPATPLPALIFGCTADPLIHYQGGKPWYAFGFAEPVRGIEQSVQAWRELAGLPDTPEVVRLPARDARGKTSATRFMWGQAADGMQVGLYRIDGAGHAEPSRLKRYPRFINWLTGLQNADLEVAEAAWDFFREKRARLSPCDRHGSPSRATPRQWLDDRPIHHGEHHAANPGACRHIVLDGHGLQCRHLRLHGRTGCLQGARGQAVPAQGAAAGSGRHRIRRFGGRAVDRHLQR